jgi:arylsulfatase A-like enzyme
MRNVVLLCLDTVRKDVFDRHAPRLTDRAGIVYDSCRAASSWSVPSHASMFTGDLPSQHGIHAHNRNFGDLDRDDTFLGRLPDYDALGVSANVWAGPSFGFDELFDAFSVVSPDRRFPEGLDVARFGQECDAEGAARHLAFLRAALGHDRSVASLANGAVVQAADILARLPVPNPFDDGARVLVREARSLVKASAEPFFLFANFMDAHGPLHHVRGYDRSLHDAPLSWRSDDVDWRAAVEAGDETALTRYRGLYAAAVDYLDRQVVELVDWLETATNRETVVVVTSDHGDNLGTAADEGRWGHVESSLTEGLLHVPLAVLNGPEADINEDRYVSHLSLGDLLVDLAASQVPKVTADRIAAERIGHSGSLATVKEHRGTEADRLVRAVYEGERKYVWGSTGEATVYRLDPGEPCWQERVEETFNPDRFADLFDVPAAAAKRRAESASERAGVDEAVRTKLDDLGYV